MRSARLDNRCRRALVVLVAAGMTIVGLGGPVAADDGWDPRIADLAREVERLRGLEFAHAVDVEVLGNRAFERRLLSGGKPTARDRREWDQNQAAFIAMGLLDERIDLDELRTASGSNIGGYYDPDRGTIVVRGSEIEDPGTRAVLAHELTHALQDQHFPMVALQRRAARADSMLTKALFEGDATDVERQYYSELSTREQDAAGAAEEGSLTEATPLPPFLDALFVAPYLLGADAVSVLRALGGQESLDAAMEQPPTRDLGLIDPTALVGPHEWVRVAAPKLGPGEAKQGDPFPMDAVGLYLVLAERLPWTDALVAAERWGGDRAVAFTRDGQSCVRMRYAGRHGVDDAVAIGDEFRRWATVGGTDAVVTQVPEHVTVTVCEPLGPVAAPAPAPPAQAMVGLSIRNNLVAELLDGGASLRVAKCTADRLARLPELGALVTSVDSLSTVPEGFSATLRNAVGANVVGFERACDRAG